MPVVLAAVVGARRRPDLAAAAVVLVLVSGVASARAWAGVAPRQLGPFDGWATLVTDPAPVGRATGVVLEVHGERFEVFAYGSVARRLGAVVLALRVDREAKAPVGRQHRAGAGHAIGHRIGRDLGLVAAVEHRHLVGTQLDRRELGLGIGRHAREDLPVLIEQLRQSHPDLVLDLLPAVGEMPEVTRCLAKAALQAGTRI